MNPNFVEIRKYRAEATLHRHDFHQIVLPHLGNLELEVEGRGGRVQPGVGAFITAGENHAFLAKGENEFVVIDLPARHRGTDPLACSFNNRAFFVIGLPVQGLLDYATTTLETATPSAALMTHWAALLVDGLARDHRLPPNAETAALGRAKAFMRVNVSKPIGIADIAAAAGLSSTRLYALFRKHQGQSPYAALMQLRIDVAQRLLVGTTLSIAEIAVRTGHADQSALTRRTREILGVTPAALRRANQSGYGKC